MTIRSRWGACCSPWWSPTRATSALQPLVRARPLLCRLHGRALALRREPLGGATHAEGPAVAGGERHCQAGRRRQLRGHLLGGAGPPRRPFRGLGGSPGTRALRPGRGFTERTHVHTSMFDLAGASYRDDDPVPIDLALDRQYDGLFILWWDAAEGTAAGLLERLAADHLPALLEHSEIEIASSWVPSVPDEGPRDVPMDLGSPAGGTDRLVQLLFVSGDVEGSVDQVRATPSRWRRAVWPTSCWPPPSSAPSSAPTPTSTSSDPTVGRCSATRRSSSPARPGRSAFLSPST